MSKKKLIILISSILAFVTVAVLSTILIVKSINSQNSNNDEKPEITESELITLSKPLNLEIDGYSLSWQKVENATNYMVYVGLKEYKTENNSYNLTGLVDEGDLISVRACGSEEYIDSVKSVELIFVNKINDQEIASIKESLKIFIEKNHHKMLEDDILQETALKVFYAGITNDDINKIIEKINALIETNKAIVGYDKIDYLKKIFEECLELFDSGINEYALVTGFLNTLALYFDVFDNSSALVKLNNLETKYYDNEQIFKNYDYLSEYLKNLSNFSIQYISTMIHYYRLYKVQVENFVELFDNGNFMQNANLLTEATTFKNTLCHSLINEMPLTYEYDVFKKIVLTVYENISYSYLLDNVSSLELESYFNNLYTYNHYMLSFLDSLDDKDCKNIINQVMNIYNSVDDETKDAIDNVFNLFDPNYKENLYVILKDNFKEVFGEQGFSVNQSFKDKIKEFKEIKDFDNLIEEIKKYLDLDTYFVFNETATNKFDNYFKDLIPEKYQNIELLTAYLQDVLSSIDYDQYLSIDVNNIFASVNQDEVIKYFCDYFVGIITYEELGSYLMELLNFDQALTVDFKGLLNELGELTLNEMPKLSAFINDLNNLDSLNVKEILAIFDITEEDVDIDIKGFLANLRELIGFEYNKAFTKENFTLYIDQVYQDVYKKIGKLEQFYNIINIFINMDNEDFTEIDVEEFMKEGSIDYLSIYTLFNYLEIKYAKFEGLYVPYYNNGLNINNLKENAQKLIVYYLFGVNAEYSENVIIGAMNILEKYVLIFTEYEKILDIIEHQNEVFKAIYDNLSIDYILALYNDENQFMEFMNSFDQEIYESYEKLMYLLDIYPLYEKLVFNRDLAILIESYGYENIGKILRDLADGGVAGYTEFLNEIELKIESYDEKSKAIRRIYTNFHLLIDPIKEFVDEVLDIYFVDGEISQADMIDILGLISGEKKRITSFYKKDLLINLGNDLNVVFEGYGIEWNLIIDEICLYGDLIINRLNATNFYSSMLSCINPLFDIITNFNNIVTIYNDFESKIRDDSISYSELQNEYNLAYQLYLKEYTSLKNNSLTLIELIDKFINAGLEELKDENIEYINRKNDFLLKDDYDQIFKYLDELNAKLLVEFPTFEDFTFSDKEKLSAFLKSLIDELLK